MFYPSWRWADDGVSRCPEVPFFVLRSCLSRRPCHSVDVFRRGLLGWRNRSRQRCYVVGFVLSRDGHFFESKKALTLIIGFKAKTCNFAIAVNTKATRRESLHFMDTIFYDSVAQYMPKAGMDSRPGIARGRPAR